ncbi:tetratricopeptide repeat protein [Ponticaulis sp.]|uniref:tetratricopeptide repeat protein n=1 Tax=Ponticaulis sp. TaxID=2020902 RepID=UPI0025D8AE8D|nr:tetratricopeptide repeat protein [Ponticaulis sp.]|tara:strand:+ start:16711 stop:18477 length:1767 start_codon:yes stop_codon:yes gene_type:complete
MKLTFRSVLACAGISALAACTTPSATSRPTLPEGWVQAPEPPEADQYSDFLIGRYASLTNDPVLAAETFLRASNRAPDDAVLKERAIFSLLLAGDTDEALEMARENTNELGSFSSLSRLALGVSEMEAGNYAAAREILTTGEVGPFNRIVSRMVAAWAAYGEGDYTAADTHIIESLVGDDVLDGVSLYMLALLQMSEGDDEEALGTFRAVWSERMRLAVAAEHYMRVLVDNGRSEEALRIADEFYSDVGHNPAIDVVEQSIRAGEEVSVQRLTPREGAALSMYSLAAALAAETQDDVAGVYFNLALVLNPELDIARNMLGSTLDAAGRGDEAISILTEVSPSSPFYATSQGQLAWIYRRKEMNEEAIRVASEALEVTEDRELTIQLGELYRSLERFDEAHFWFDKVITQDEADGREDWLVYYARGVVNHELDNWAAAEADFLRSLEIDGTQAQVLNYLGYSWVDRGEHLERAFVMIQQAVALQPYSGYIVDSLGWAYYRLGQYDQAVLFLEHAVELAPDDPTLNDHLGDAYWRVGRELEARFQWRHALAQQPDEELVPQIEAKIANGLTAEPVSVLADGNNEPTETTP